MFLEEKDGGVFAELVDRAASSTEIGLGRHLVRDPQQLAVVVECR
jgi:hypothetical protein